MNIHTQTNKIESCTLVLFISFSAVVTVGKLITLILKAEYKFGSETFINV